MHLKRSSSFLLCWLLWLASACGSKQEARDVSQKQPPRTESQLSLSGTTIEQADENGHIVWKIEVERANYSPDRKTAKLEGLKGNLFENGKVVMQVSAAEGEVEKDADRIILNKKVIALDPRNQTTIKSEKAQWYSQKKILVIPEQLTGDRQDLAVTARSGTYEAKTQRLQLQGKIIANKKDPQLQLKTEELVWEIPQQRIVSDRSLEILRYQNKKIVDRLTGDRGTVSLKDSLATLENNVALNSIQPNLQITTAIVTWNYTNRLVRTTQTIQIDDRAKQITLTGEGGQVDLTKAIATLHNGTQAVDRLQDSQLYADDLIWYFDRNTVEAVGNIRYRQERPKMTLIGDRAVGNLQSNQIKVTNKQGKQVETKIVISN